MYLPRRGALELFADRIELVRELLASCGDRDLTAGLLELRVNIEFAVHALDRGAAQACDRTRGFDRELANLVLLIEAGLDLFDHVVEVLHRRADGPSRYLRVGPQAKAANPTTVRPTASRPCPRWLTC